MTSAPFQLAPPGHCSQSRLRSGCPPHTAPSCTRMPAPPAVLQGFGTSVPRPVPPPLCSLILPPMSSPLFFHLVSHPVSPSSPPSPAGPSPLPQSQSSSGSSSSSPMSPRAQPPQAGLLPKQPWSSAFSLGAPGLWHSPRHPGGTVWGLWPCFGEPGIWGPEVWGRGWKPAALVCPLGNWVSLCF